MPPKTAVAKPKAGAAHAHPPKSANPPRRAAGASKPAEEAVPPVGPIIKLSLTNTAPPPPGRSFLDVLEARRRATAQPSTSAPVAAPAPVSTPAAAAAAPPTPPLTPTRAAPVSSAGAGEARETPAGEASQPVKDAAVAASLPEGATSPAGVGLEPEVAEVAVEAEVREDLQPPTPPVEAVVDVAAAPSPAAVPFSWATDTDDDINFQFHQPSPQFVVEYPEGVLENRAHNVTFKVPAESQLLTSAVAELRRERQAFLAERQELEERRARLDEEESNLVKLKQQHKEEEEKLQKKKLQLLKQQEELQQEQQLQQQKRHISPTQSPGVAMPSASPPAHAPPPPRRAHGGAAPEYISGAQKDWVAAPDWSQPDGWAGEMGVMANYDIYGGVGTFQPQQQQQQRAYNYRSAMAGVGAMGPPQLRSGPQGGVGGRMLPTQPQHHMGGGIAGGQLPQHFNNNRMQGMSGAPGMAGRPQADGKTFNFVNRNPVQQPQINGYNKSSW